MYAGKLFHWTIWENTVINCSCKSNKRNDQCPHVQLRKPRTEKFKRDFIFRTSKKWNSLNKLTAHHEFRLSGNFVSNFNFVSWVPSGVKNFWNHSTWFPVQWKFFRTYSTWIFGIMNYKWSVFLILFSPLEIYNEQLWNIIFYSLISKKCNCNERN